MISFLGLCPQVRSRRAAGRSDGPAQGPLGVPCKPLLPATKATPPLASVSLRTGPASAPPQAQCQVIVLEPSHLSPYLWPLFTMHHRHVPVWFHWPTVAVACRSCFPPAHLEGVHPRVANGNLASLPSAVDGSLRQHPGGERLW